MKPFSPRACISPPSIRHSIRAHRRSYAVQAPGAPTLEVFSRSQKWLQKERAASNAEASRQADYLKDEVASRLCERLLPSQLQSILFSNNFDTQAPTKPPAQDINRHFPKVLDLGANACNIAAALTRPNPDPDPSKPVSAPSPTASASSPAPSPPAPSSTATPPSPSTARSPSPATSSPRKSSSPTPNTFDAVLSSLSLHWINDLPSVLSQINSILKPDAPFLGVMLGGDSLYELRTSLQLAELSLRGGVSTRTSPRRRFKLLTVDVDDIIVEYPSSFALMADLQAMGESNAVLSREQGPIRRDVLVAAEAIYRELHAEGRQELPATFRLIYMIGWKEGPNQSQPLPRGSGMVSIKEILEGGGGGGGGGGGKK
ncbi:hypothetical protein H2199_007632 [Coniosporium tulheliwenetii]|uniref:Uncharacterized protein n=1 Tax=Coniosporium tulheliwenetii TaxID=3383036 RepID=A0ACC2YPP5_9PEZI|nr:hypothetical protein H2199_007632 [Cladosporium sp. JES 115]